MIPTFMDVPSLGSSVARLDTLQHPGLNGAAMSPAAAQPRLLLLGPTTTYRTEDFVEAARRLDVDLVVAAEKPNTMAAALPDHLLTLPFDDPPAAAALMRDYARARPVAAVVPVDDATTVVGAAIGQALGLRANALSAVSATRDKQAMRDALARGGVRQLPLRAQAARSLGEPRCHPRRHAGRVRRRLEAHRGHPHGARCPGAGRRRVEDPRGGFRAGRRGVARGDADGGRSGDAGDLRQAGPPRRALLRRDDLRHALPAAGGDPEGGGRGHGAGRPGARPVRRTGPRRAAYQR